MGTVNTFQSHIESAEPASTRTPQQLGLELAFGTHAPSPAEAMPLFDAPAPPEFLGIMPNVKPPKHTVQLGEFMVKYALKRSSRRSIGFSIGLKGLTVAAPQRASIAMVEAALQTKQKWIIAKLRLVQTKASQHTQRAAQRFAHGATLPYLGKHVVLKLGSGTSRTRLQHGMFGEETLLLSLDDTASESEIHQAVHAWLKQEAKKRFAERLPIFEAALNVKASNWRLSNAKGRWGSASSAGKISLHWRLIQQKPEIIDYVIVHELAHLLEMNHSPRFWAWVASVCPDYRTLRKALKQESIYA
jgi:predicted metal-dependent hydrolase